MEDCMEMNEAMLSSPAWQFRMLHVAHRSALDSLLERHGLKDYGHPFILFLLMRSGEDGLHVDAEGAVEVAEGLARRR